MNILRSKTLIAAAAFAMFLGSAFGAAAYENCGFAYGFCMPIYNACISDGGHPNDCVALLDQCILNNGCSVLP